MGPVRFSFWTFAVNSCVEELLNKFKSLIISINGLDLNGLVQSKTLTREVPYRYPGHTPMPYFEHVVHFSIHF